LDVTNTFFYIFRVSRLCNNISQGFFRAFPRRCLLFLPFVCVLEWRSSGKLSLKKTQPFRFFGLNLASWLFEIYKIAKPICERTFKKKKKKFDVLLVDKFG
jgi:hypothetical protein